VYLKYGILPKLEEIGREKRLPAAFIVQMFHK
jgi:hypothetical protein